MSTRYRSLVQGGFFSESPFDRTVPVSMRCNNPGAINGAPWEEKYPGYIDTVETTPGNKTTIFEAPEYGVAVWWELLSRYAAEGTTTVESIITRYGGGQDYSAYVRFVTARTGFQPTTIIPLNDDNVLLPFARAMFHYEAGRQSPLHDDQILYGLKLGRAKGSASKAGTSPAINMGNTTPPDSPAPEVPGLPSAAHELTLDTRDGVKAIQSVLINCGYLDPPADGAWGRVSKWAMGRFASQNGLAADGTITPELKDALLAAVPLPLVPGGDLAGRVVKGMQKNGYWIARHPDCLNIVYIEGMDPDGGSNDNRNNVFNDARMVFRIEADGSPNMVGAWEATTEPSRKWTLEPMNPGGAFHIKFGQYKAWIRGWYHTHDALVQAGEIEGYRDPNKTFKRDYNHPVKGADFGVHQHWGYYLPHDNMGNSSAGCLVGRSTKGHREFMKIVLKDARFRANPAYLFISAIMPVGDLPPA